MYVDEYESVDFNAVRYSVLAALNIANIFGYNKCVMGKEHYDVLMEVLSEVDSVKKWADKVVIDLRIGGDVIVLECFKREVE